MSALHKTGKTTSFAKKITACFIVVAFACSMLPISAMAAPADSKAAADTNLGVAFRSEQAIKNYCKANNIDIKNLGGTVKFDQSPSVNSPYSAGKVSNDTNQQALKLLNLIRYVAGIDGTVTLDSGYTEKAQAAAVVNAANGEISHNPSRPSGMSDNLYNLGKQGAQNGNLAVFSYNAGFGESLIGSWMQDSDANNINRVGHRRWILNPTMGKTGFGIVNNADKGIWNTFSSMYTMDFSRTNATETNVAWPAQTTPIELFTAGSAWSLSTGSTVNINTVKVTVKRATDGKTWNFSKNSSDGDFYVNNDNYGQTGCIIFKPKDLTVNSNDYFDVSVTGVAKPVNYNVNFTTLSNEITSAELELETFEYTGKAIRPKVTVKYHETVLTENKDYTVSYSNNVNVGKGKVTVTGIGDYTGSKTCEFTILPNSENGGGNNGGGVDTSPTYIYRLYNPYSSEHLFTTDANERGTLVSLGWNDEGIGWSAPSSGKETYRVFNPYSREHHYTTDANERDTLVKLGWRYEKVAWYSGGNVKLHRLFNPYATTFTHHYTKDDNEKNELVKLGWKYEGTGWNGLG